MQNRPKILITNDDGIHAPGIKHLGNALKEFADLTIIAPMIDQSAVSLSITIRQPLNIKKINWHNNIPAWSVTGTPADCVKLGLAVILDKQPDLVVSGINRGTNSGRNVLYSGTVGGTIEAVFHNIPGIAFSCYDYLNPNFLATENHILKIVEYTLKNPLPGGSLLNVNFPSEQHGPLKGIKMTRQGKAYWMEDPDHRKHPSEGHSYYWLGAKLSACIEQEDSDVHWLNQGFATAVPVQVSELTDYRHIEKNKLHFDSLFDF
jgi:5'-nucleotidase